MRYAVLATPLMAVAFSVLAAPAAFAQNDIRTEQVHFKAGANSAVIEGKITGFETIDYVLEASKGQHMNVSMATKNGANYFNILAPGENEVAIFNGSVKGNQYEGVFPESGAYKVRVYMMRSAARRNEVAKYRLEMVVTGAAEKAARDATAASPNTGQAALAVDKAKMLAQCRSYAASHLRVSPDVINVKYEGQRTDGTHAVNGNTESTPPLTFQCSFDAAGQQIVNFIRNEPQASSETNSSPAKSKGMPSKDEQACLQAVSIKTNNGDVTVLSTKTSEANNVVIVGVGPNKAPWRCLVSKGVVAEVSSQTDEGRL
jgi:hypothetical protein